MKRYISPAIIMRIREFRESDLLVTFFTPDRGRLKGVAKGARRSRQRFVNCLDLFCLVDLEYGLKRGGDLHMIHAGKLRDAYPGLRSDFSALSLASYMIELTETLFPLDVADPAMFELLKTALEHLGERKHGEQATAMFETRAMALGGYGINLEKCCVCGRAYTSQGMAVFDRERGGIACLKCRQASERAPLLSPRAVQGLRSAQLNPFRNAEAFGQDEEGMRQVRAVLKLHREYRLEKRLKTAKYVE